MHTIDYFDCDKNEQFDFDVKSAYNDSIDKLSNYSIGGERLNNIESVHFTLVFESL